MARIKQNPELSCTALEEDDIREQIEQVTQISETLDTMLSSMEITNRVAVGALSHLHLHAVAQMYSASIGRPDLHEAIVLELLPIFERLDRDLAERAFAALCQLDSDGALLH